MSGTVRSVYHNFKGGNQIIIDNDDGSVNGYAHTDAVVVPGQRVSSGDQVGTSDGSGRVTGPHLHLTYRDQASSSKSDPKTEIGNSCN